MDRTGGFGQALRSPYVTGFTGWTEHEGGGGASWGQGLRANLLSPES